MDFLVWLESSGFSSWVRESSSIWAYPFVLFLHTMGLATLVGSSAVVDLRILGVASRVPLAPLQRLFPFMWWGFALNLISGATLLAADATTKATNPVFYVKMVLVAIGLVTIRLLRNRVFGNSAASDSNPLPSNAKLLAIASLVIWIGATTAGRLMAYIGPVSGLVR
jgi:hypothetical protein